MKNWIFLLAMAALAVTTITRGSSVVNSSNLPPGAIVPHSGSTCPAGTILANGASLLRTGQYANLFSAISTNWGAVDGSHFTIPNLLNRFARGAGASTDGNGGTTVSLGAYQEAETRIYTAMTSGTESALHTHTYFAMATINGPSNTCCGSYGNYAGILTMSTESVGHFHQWGAGQGGTETRPKSYGVNFCIKY